MTYLRCCEMWTLWICLDTNVIHAFDGLFEIYKSVFELFNPITVFDLYFNHCSETKLEYTIHTYLLQMYSSTVFIMYFYSAIKYSSTRLILITISNGLGGLAISEMWRLLTKTGHLSAFHWLAKNILCDVWNLDYVTQNI